MEAQAAIDESVAHPRAVALAVGWRVWLGSILAVTAACYASYLLVVGLIDGHHLDIAGQLELRHGAVISTLIGFVLVCRLTWFRDLRADVAGLAPLLDGPAPLAPEQAPEFAPGPLRVAAVLGGIAGFAIAGASFGSVAHLWATFDAHVVWAFVANVVLFALIAQLAWTQRAGESFLERAVTSRLRVPLLDREGLDPYARRGLRGSLFWFLGSSIASLLFINWGFSWTVFVVILSTLAMGVFALLEPSRRLRPRIQQAKRAELARVRAAIEEARRAALGPGDAEAVARLPGLLAWEARIESVHEWPFDAATWLRFAALALVAVGSWLGGALVERVLGLALD